MITREIYIEKLENRLDRWNAYLHKLEKRARHFKGEIKISFEEKLVDIRNLRDIVVQKLEKIRSAADGTWINLKKETKEARGKLVDAFSRAHVQIGTIIDTQGK
jgi:hypothetical protein